tara:strand:- start:446 stop:637 length:192 start_codon:yes stop_codon:yes gene_type:complete
MRIHILDNVEFEGRNFEKGTSVLMVSDEAKRLVETGKATYEETNRSVGLKSSNVEAPSKRGKK